MKWFLLVMQCLPAIFELVKKIDEVLPKDGIGSTVKGPGLSEMISIASDGEKEVESRLDKIVPVMVKMLKDGKASTYNKNLVEN